MTNDPSVATPETAAEAILLRLKQHGIDYFFANAGTDFAPIIEAYSKNELGDGDADIPIPLICPHENAAIGMAHGFYVATGRPQAVMLHVNVGLANALMGIINAASDQIPIFVMAGRTPSTEGARLGARSLPIHWGQDMRDQSAIVREFVKWDYEMKLPDQAADLIDRGYAVAMSHPRGPVYLGLPREALGMAWEEQFPFGEKRHALSSPPAPTKESVEEAARLIKMAKKPMLISQRGDPLGALGQAVERFAENHGVAVAEFWTTGNLMATDHPMHCGFDPGPLLEDADLVIVLDAMVPWLNGFTPPKDDAVIIQIGADPLFSRVPVRGFRSALNLTSLPVAAIEALDAALSSDPARDDGAISERRKAIAALSNAKREQAREKAEAGAGDPMTPAYVSKVLSDCFKGEDARIFSELGCDPAFMRFEGANQFHSHALAGGLGWGLPAALGAALAEPDRIHVACVGDGSYMFANPVACHQIAEAHGLPILTIVFNNAVWNAVRKTTLMMYPTGHASRMNTVPLSSLAPNPDFTKVAEASRGFAQQVERPENLRPAIEEALYVIKNERRQALLDVIVSQG
ncbi:MAG: thiamine pyrophosphate-requiring protein [Pseudomonadota bacterium]